MVIFAMTYAFGIETFEWTKVSLWNILYFWNRKCLILRRPLVSNSKMSENKKALFFWRILQEVDVRICLNTASWLNAGEHPSNTNCVAIKPAENSMDFCFPCWMGTFTLL